MAGPIILKPAVSGCAVDCIYWLNKINMDASKACQLTQVVWYSNVAYHLPWERSVIRFGKCSEGAFERAQYRIYWLDKISVRLHRSY